MYLKLRMNILIRLMVIFTSLFLLSCGIFEPRDSEDPLRPIPWEPNPIHRDQIISNLKNSYLFSENGNNYNKIFTDDFVFHFANQDISEQGTPTTLDLTQESEIILNLHKYLGDFNQQIFIDTLSNISGQADVFDNTSATLYRSYYIRIENRSKNRADTRIFQGKAEFYLIQDNESFWKMKSWKDYRTTTNQTWGLLKNDFTF